MLLIDADKADIILLSVARSFASSKDTFEAALFVTM